MLQVGDKVKLSMPANREDWWNKATGYGEVWIEEMDCYHNRWVIVKEISWRAGVFFVVGDNEKWGFPLMCIKEKAW